MRQAINYAVKISFVLYLSILFLLLFVRHRGMIWSDLSAWQYAKIHMNLIPTKTILEYAGAWIHGTMNWEIPVENIFGNFFLFLPMGIYLPRFYKNIDNSKKFLAVMTILLLLVEVMQFLTKRGSFDIDDFILNLCGALVGYWIWTKTKRRNRS